MFPAGVLLLRTAHNGRCLRYRATREPSHATYVFLRRVENPSEHRMQPGPRYHSRPAPQSASCSYRGLVITSRCGEVRRRRAELAKYDMRRSTIRRWRDDMPRCTIRRPHEPASEVAKIGSSLRRLEPPAPAARCVLVFGSPVRSTEPGSCRSPDWHPRAPQEGSHCRYWPHLLQHHSDLGVPAAGAVA